MMCKDDDFILNCRPTVPVGCEEQVGSAKCTRPFLSCEGAGTQTTADAFGQMIAGNFGEVLANWRVV